MKAFGLIGYPLTHSFSKKYFDTKFEKEGIEDVEFLQFSIPSINQINEVINTPFLQGFAITIPHKKGILPFLHQLSPAVEKMGACNCVKIHNGNLYGFNTDVIGFEKSFTPLLQKHHRKALILGTGGAAAAVEFVLQKINIDYVYVSRTKQPNTLTYDALNETVFNNYQVIINCTPLGTYPNVDELPRLPYHLLTSQHYLYDLVYNPPLTAFLKQGQKFGCTIKNGYDMLTIQAEENWKIWNE